jgi:hypothetical protein
MPAVNLEQLISTIRSKMTQYNVYKKYKMYEGEQITEQFLRDVNMLQEQYGKYIGKAKATNKGDKELEEFDTYITGCFEGLLKTSRADPCFQLLNLAIGKISQVISYVQTLESLPKNVVSKTLLDQVTLEKEHFEKTAKFLAEYRGLPELNSLIISSRNIGLLVDDNWALALCASNLIEATVNMKLEKLGLKIEGSFKDKYRKLCTCIKEKENQRDISQLLPIALYEGIRNKLDHASNSNRVTEKEAKDISRIVVDFMNEIFQ